LLREAGADAMSDDLIAIAPEGVEAQADWAHLESPETYVGYQQGHNFASLDGVTIDEPRTYSVLDQLRLNSWALAGDWTVARRAAVLNRAGGAIAPLPSPRRQPRLAVGERDSRAVRRPARRAPPGADHGFDVDENGEGTLVRPRLYQLIRQQGPMADRTSKSPSTAVVPRRTSLRSAKAAGEESIDVLRLTRVPGSSSEGRGSGASPSGPVRHRRLSGAVGRPDRAHAT
jgi:hypothetical protein